MYQPYNLSRNLSEIINTLRAPNTHQPEERIKDIGFKVKDWLEKDAARRTGDKSLKGLPAAQIAERLLASNEPGVQGQHKLYAAIYQFTSAVYNQHLDDRGKAINGSLMSDQEKAKHMETLSRVVQQAKNDYAQKKPVAPKNEGGRRFGV